MHRSPGKSLFAFLALLLLGLISHSTASPITNLVAASSSISIPSVHNGTLIPPSGALPSLNFRQQQDWTMNLYWQSQRDGSYVAMPVCDTNYNNGNMCSVGYFTSTYLSSATIWIWDNTCKQIGYANPVSYGDLASGNVNIASSLPASLQVQVLGNPQDGHSPGFNVNFWYQAAPLWGWFDPLAVDPYPCCRLGDEDHEFFSMVLPFQCH